ncbi:MAG TPA: hypothetical protein VHW23_00315 [Kofleriaceae bacterium]|nr:hypothetical protein [Kofleriaceae bacterium]
MSIPSEVSRPTSDLTSARRTKVTQPIETQQAASNSAPLEKDPRQPNYDAARLFSLRYDNAKLIFESEPRDEKWARQRESGIVDAALDEFRRVDPTVQMEVECHTGICRARVHSRNKRIAAAMFPYPLQCLAQFAEPEWGDLDAEDPFSDFYLIFGADTRSNEGFAARRASLCPRYREDWLRRASMQ